MPSHPKPEMGMEPKLDRLDASFPTVYILSLFMVAFDLTKPE